MRFLWYWPFARREELDWASGTARDGESIVVQVIDRREAPPAGNIGAITVVRDLVDVDRRELSGVRWLGSRTKTYRERSNARKRLWQSEQFDLVHLHYLNRFTDAISPLPRPLVMSVHDVLPHAPRLWSAAEHRLLKRVYGRADALVVHHQRLADQLIDDFGIPAISVFVVPHQVFPVDDAPDAPPVGPPMILFFGALRANKGLEVLDAALSQLPSADLRVRIVGHGDHAVEVLAQQMAARDARVTTDIGFASLENKRQLFRDASLVVLPYTSFTSQSGVLHDAYGHGRPVVVSDVGALGDSVREDGTGMVVPPGDPSSLASAISASLEEPAWREHADAARLVARERSPAAVGLRLREVYDQVLGTPKPR